MSFRNSMNPNPDATDRAMRTGEPSEPIREEVWACIVSLRMLAFAVSF